MTVADFDHAAWAAAHALEPIEKLSPAQILQRREAAKSRRRSRKADRATQRQRTKWANQWKGAANDLLADAQRRGSWESAAQEREFHRLDEQAARSSLGREPRLTETWLETPGGRRLGTVRHYT